MAVWSGHPRVAIVILARRITGPLTGWASAGRLATGDLDGPLPEARSRDEVVH